MPPDTLGAVVHALAEIRELLAASSGPPPLLVPAEQAARMLSMGESTFYRAAGAGEVPRAVDTPGGPRWLVADLQAWAKARTAKRRRKQQRGK